MTERRWELVVLSAFGATFVAGLALLGLYIVGGQTQVEGLLLTVCLGGIGIGIVVWAQRLMPSRVHVEPRPPIGTDPSRIEGLAEALTEEAGFSRRTLLIRARSISVRDDVATWRPSHAGAWRAGDSRPAGRRRPDRLSRR
jgi:hypothetical protein